MFDIGDVFVQSVSNTDNATPANPVNSGSVVVTITLPDSTTQTPTVTNPTTGTYTATYPLTQSGRHRIEWVGTGSNAFTQSDVFYVGAVDPGFIIGLAEARSSLRLPPGQTVDDEDLRELIAASTVVMEDLCGAIVPRACDEMHDGGYFTIRPDYAPLFVPTPNTGLTLLTEAYGAGYIRTLTYQPLDGTAASYDSFGYTVDPTDGIVQRRFSGIEGQFIAGRRNVHIQYTAGRNIIRWNLIRATRRQVRFMWQQEMQGQRPAGGAAESVASTPSGYLVPNAVRALCADDLRIVGVG